MKIKIFFSDVDGVLTDGGMFYTESGDEFKKFNAQDG
jgi:3-deoxy-D-manno-octulosonate 8-phosphate phosphatase (KDO 8-P phosphatase)